MRPPATPTPPCLSSAPPPPRRQERLVTALVVEIMGFLQGADGGCLVYCDQGMHRSATVVALVLGVLSGAP